MAALGLGAGRHRAISGWDTGSCSSTSVATGPMVSQPCQCLIVPGNATDEVLASQVIAPSRQLVSCGVQIGYVANEVVSSQALAPHDEPLDMLAMAGVLGWVRSMSVTSMSSWGPGGRWCAQSSWRGHTGSDKLRQ